MDANFSQFSGLARRQRGMATLIIALIILVSMTIITLYTARVGVFETRTSANEVRSEQVFSTAEFGVQEGLAYLDRNRSMISSAVGSGWMATPNWVQCAGEVALPCGDGSVNVYGNNYVYYADVPNTTAPDSGTYSLHYVTRCKSDGAGGCDGNARPQENPVIDVIARGTTADTTGFQTVKTSTHIGPSGFSAPDAPLIAAGSVPLSGNFNIVAAPNAGGEGVPVSVWSGEDADTDSTSFATCHLDEFLASGTIDDTQVDGTEDMNTIEMCSGCTCGGGGMQTLSEKNEEDYDILDNDGNYGANEDTGDFPPDLFLYAFGRPISEYEVIRNKALVLDADGCSALDATASGYIWVEGGGECAPGSVGSFASPVILILDRTNFRLNAGSYIFGVVFSFHPDAYEATPPADSDYPQLTLNGGATIYGSVMSVGSLQLNGTMRIRYDEQTLANAGSGGDNGALVPIAGTWADY